MLGSSFLPARLRSSDSENKHHKPTWLSQRINPFLLSLSGQACRHPINTIIFVAIIASTTYLGLLESSLFERQTSLAGTGGRVDFDSLLAGSKRLYAGADSNWNWQIQENGHDKKVDNNFALITFVFPNSVSSTPQTAPQPKSVPAPSNSTASVLPCSTNPLSQISQDTTLAYSMPFEEAESFLYASKEIPVSKDASQVRYLNDGTSEEEKKWIMKAAKSTTRTSGGVRLWLQNAWTDFLDLLKNAETLDITIMILGYLSMHLTFVALFLSMRRLGSNFWLGATVLISSSFAFLFGLIVTTRLGVPLNMVLLSEGLPFLVVTVGFEKPIVLTKAVLAHSLDRRRMDAQPGNDKTNAAPTIQYAVRTAVKNCGAEIVRDYLVEIAILVAGAASGVQGGLRQFCFLAAWILFFDCILLFTFYTSILTIKLEINRIKRHVQLRKALEDDGVSSKVAENVAASNDASSTSNSNPSETPIFGKEAGDTSIPRFKVLMVTGFLLVNVLNLCTIPFRNSASPALSSLSSVVMQPPMDPFKVAGNGLDRILSTAQRKKRSTIVTVLSPIKYELEYPSVHYASGQSEGVLFDTQFADQMLGGRGGKAVGSFLKSFNDPVLSKWIVIALVMSLVMNGYLFNAARLTIKEPARADQPPKANKMMVAPSSTNLNLARPPQRQAQPSHNTEVSDSTESEDGGLTMKTPSKAQPTLAGTRTRQECEDALKAKLAPQLLDEELIDLSVRGLIPGYALEKTLGDMTRAVKIRRAVISRTHATRETSGLLESSNLPYKHYDYERVHGACCENVIGYLPLPVGVAGPMMIDGQNYFLPMATTEGVLVASTSRGAKAINAGGGAQTVITGDGMTRGPCVSFESVRRAGEAKNWLDSEAGTKVMRDAFNSTSRFARLQSMRTALAGTYLYIRFKTTTGDAMGMNMISKGVEHALKIMSTEAGFDDMAIVSVSGNYCTDKKAAAINWIDGRGKSVVAEAIIPEKIVRTVLKSSVDALVELNISKNLIGSAMAGSVGGNNAHAANIVAAIFLATGQDPAQVVESSSCITIMKNVGGNLQISVSMPCIEVGTIGGGTILEPQSAMLDLLGVRGPHPTTPGDNARQLARVIAAGVLAGELSLCSALAAGHLVQAHMAHNRSAAPSAAPSRATTPTPGGRPGNQTPTTLAMTSMKDNALKLTSERR
ncbi:hydroxymethylglutaryl-CoA reductase (NADPH) [Venturia nashicola]|uniref:3-hydroxy-3-methylglutaryl coenzyme A reductase n=1 Tax=Venturia nashicola TaxID=86259 RepID=A0A4Z1NUC9_9PEZI|nr:hydroxymethylglutaryl-CoA reductase (NADPH) [Venturia nashicola]